MRANPYIIVIAIASAAAAAFVGVLFFLLPNSQQILLLSQRKLLAAKSFAYSARFGYEPRAAGAGRVIVSASGVVAKAPAASDNHVDVVWDGGQRIAAAGRIKAFPGTWYANAEYFSASAKLPVNPDALVGSWLRLTSADLAPTSFASFVAHAPTPAEAQAYTERVRRVPLFVFREKVGGGVFSRDPYHYRADVQAPIFKDLFIRWRELVGGRPLEDEERAEIDTRFGAAEPGVAEIWIGKDFLPRRIQIPFQVRARSGEADAVLDISFNQFNAASDIEPPTGSVIDFGDAFAAMFPATKSHLSLAGEATAKPTGTASAAPVAPPLPASDDDADHDGLNAKLEAFYGTDPHKADTDGDGVSDGQEVAQGDNPTGSGSLFSFGLPFP